MTGSSYRRGWDSDSRVFLLRPRTAAVEAVLSYTFLPQYLLVWPQKKNNAAEAVWPGVGWFLWQGWYWHHWRKTILFRLVLLRSWWWHDHWWLVDTLRLTFDASLSNSSVQSLYRFGRRGDMRDDSAEILFQSFLQEALVSSSGMGRDVHSLILSAQYFLGQPGRRPPSNVPWMMVLERPSWRVTCPNHASFCLLTVARRGSCPKRKLILLCAQSLVLCYK